MEYSKNKFCRLLIILVCWLSVNDAIPLGSDHEEQVIETTTFDRTNEFSETIPITVQPIVTSTPMSENGRSKDLIDRNHHMENHQIKKNNEGRRGYQIGLKDRRNPLTISETDDDDPKNHISNNHNSLKSHDTDFEEWEMPISKIQSNDKCVNEERRKNQTYTRSIPLNTSSIDPEEDFEIPGDPQVKKTSSVHMGEDIALCWIETTTIKEDNHFDPPKRLVIREYTISFENSASISENYLECDEIEGEIQPGDEDTIRKTALHEVIEENSKRSRQINFTHVSNVGRVIIRQHKKVKCGVGAVVSKDIYQWPDGTENPKKRVEIKVGPSIRELGAMSDEKFGGCTGENVRTKAKTDRNLTSSANISDESSASCENDDCKTSRKSLLEVTTYPTDSDEILSTGVTEAMTTTNPNATKLSLSLPSKSDRYQHESCSEFDSDCISAATTTVGTKNFNETSENCTDGNCLDESSEEFNFECDQGSNSSCSCSGDNCTSEGNSTVSVEDSEQTTLQDTKLCKNGSESCFCNGSSCSTEKPEENQILESENKQRDVLVNETNETTMKIIEKSSLIDSTCNDETGICLESNFSTRSNDDEEKNGMRTITSTISNEYLDTEVYVEENSTTEKPEVSIVTKRPEENDVDSGIGNSTSCERSGFGNCSTVGTDETIRPNVTSEDAEGHFSSVEDTSAHKIIKKQLESSILTSGEIGNSSSCLEGDEGCSTSQSSKELVSTSNSTDKMTDSTSGSSGTEKISSTSENSTTLTTIRFNDAETEKATNNSHQQIEYSNKETIGLDIENIDDEENSTKKSFTGPISINVTSNDETSSAKQSMTNCSPDSKNSSDCVQQTVTNSSNSSGLTSSSDLETETLPPKSCDKSENCGSIDSSSSSLETYENVSGEAEDQTKLASSCEDGDESCQDSSSSSKNSESCEDGSDNCRNGKIGRESSACGSASNPCSSELEESGSDAMSQSTHKKLEVNSTINKAKDTVSFIGETRRSLSPTTPLSTTVKKRHRLGLRIKVLLEHIDENKEKEKLVQVEKQLLLKENSNEHGNHSLMWHLQALNNSMNLETLKAIFNCSALKSLSIDEIDVDNLSKDVINDEIDGLKKGRKNGDLEKTTAEENPEDTTEKLNDEKSSNRRKREISSLVDITTETENNNNSTTVFYVENGNDSTTEISEGNFTDATTAISEGNFTDATTAISEGNFTDATTAISEGNCTDATTAISGDNFSASTTAVPEENVTHSTTAVPEENFIDSTTRKEIVKKIPGVEEELTNGMNHVLSRISKELDDSTKIDVITTPSSFSSKILKILSDPSDSRVHFSSPKIIPRIKRSVKIEQLTDPVNGEEIERWTKERFFSAADGRQIRRLTEIRILRDNSEDC